MAPPPGGCRSWRTPRGGDGVEGLRGGGAQGGNNRELQSQNASRRLSAGVGRGYRYGLPDAVSAATGRYWRPAAAGISIAAGMWGGAAPPPAANRRWGRMGRRAHRMPARPPADGHGGRGWALPLPWCPPPPRWPRMCRSGGCRRHAQLPPLTRHTSTAKPSKEKVGWPCQVDRCKFS